MQAKWVAKDIKGLQYQGNSAKEAKILLNTYLRNIFYILIQKLSAVLYGFSVREQFRPTNIKHHNFKPNLINYITYPPLAFFILVLPILRSPSN